MEENIENEIFELDRRRKDLMLREIGQEQLLAYNYDARSVYSAPEWSGWSQQRLEQYFLEFELPHEHAAEYDAFRVLVKRRDIDGVLAFIAGNGGNQVESFWFIAYWQIIYATISSTHQAASLLKRIPWTPAEEVSVSLTESELRTAISALLDACNACSDKQIRSRGKVGNERETFQYARLRAANWSLKLKLQSKLSLATTETTAP